jgi:hypothetical protein
LTDVSCQPPDQWTRTVELGANACVGGRRVEPSLERVTANRLPTEQALIHTLIERWR